MASSEKLKRKLIVERSFQLKYAFIFALVCFIPGLLATAAIMGFSQSYYGQLERAGAFLTPTLAEIYHRGWVRLCLILGGFTLVYSLVTFYIGLILTRNIMGPVLAFQGAIRRLLKGEEETFELRSQDELKVFKEIYGEVKRYVKDTL